MALTALGACEVEAIMRKWSGCLSFIGHRTNRTIPCALPGLPRRFLRRLEGTALVPDGHMLTLAAHQSPQLFSWDGNIRMALASASDLDHVFGPVITIHVKALQQATCVS
jgi:hypothetical protein